MKLPGPMPRVLLMVSTPGQMTALAHAQDPVTQVDAPAGEPNVLLDMLENAGVVGYVIVLLAIVALAFVIENFLHLKREKLAPPGLIDEMESLFDEENFQAAVELCEQEKNYFTTCVGAGLSKLGHPFETIQTAIREMETEQGLALLQKIGWLSLISVLSPMLGLFGTVTGMFVTFADIASAGGNVPPSQLANGIKIALITTIFGLTVAIPVGLCFYILRNRVVRCSMEVNAIAEDLFERFRSR